jgi:3-methylcrotonyl-CoA carboxylase alpha subunit
LPTLRVNDRIVGQSDDSEQGAATGVFRKLLIANRGEIACRIVRTARRLGITVVGVYSQADAGARHVRLCDEAWPIGAAAAEQSYLDARAILEVAQRCKAQAIHPGYGFLSENQHFAAACAAAGITFVGPSAAAIAAMGDKAAAKERMRCAGVPVLAGYQGEEQELAALERHGRELGFPLIIKPSGGGGGKGMQIVREPGELAAALEAARRLAISAFGDERLLLERYLPAPRHIEVQVLADREGRVLHLLDRDCSVQRRHQKLIEEAPAPGLEPHLRRGLAEAASTVAREVGYEGAGTVEFLVDGAEFFFMEMNTRLQVEHPVTEAITAIDLVEWQLRIASGERLEIPQAHVAAHGHAVEVRVCAEDAARNFLPGAGMLRLASWPAERHGVRTDFGFETGDEVSPHYDSLLGKVIAHAPTRAEAIARLRGALGATFIAGVPTNIEWLAGALDSVEFRSGPVDTAFVARQGALLRDGAGSQTGAIDATAAAGAADGGALARFAAAAAIFGSQAVQGRASPWAWADGFRLGGREPVEVKLSSGLQVLAHQVRVLSPSAVAVLTAERPLSIELEGRHEGAIGAGLLALHATSGGPRAHAWVSGSHVDVWVEARHASFQMQGVDDAAASARAPAGSLTTTLPGVIVSVQAAAGQSVTAGQTLLVVEAMKMEHAIRAPMAGVIATVHVRLGDRVREGETLVTMQAPSIEGASA